MRYLNAEFKLELASLTRLKRLFFNVLREVIFVQK